MTIRMPHNVLAGDIITSVGPTAPPSPIVGTAWLNTAAASPATNILYGPNGEILLHTAGAGGVGRYSRLAGPQEDAHLRSGDAAGSYVFIEGQNAAYLCSNAYWDGTNWQRWDTGAAANAFAVSLGWYYFYNAPAGANPISWTLATLSPASVPSLPIHLDPPRVRVSRNPSQSVPSSAVTAAVFNVSDYHTGGALGGSIWDGVSTFTCPRTGVYHFGAYVGYPDVGGGAARRLAFIALSTGVNVTVGEQSYVAGTTPRIALAGEARWVAGQTAVLNMYQQTGAAQNLDPVFWLRYVCD